MTVPAAAAHRQPPLPPINPCDLPGLGGVCELGKDALDPTGVVTTAASSAFDSLVASLMDSFGKALQWCLSWWIRLPSPDLEHMSALTRVNEYTSGLQLMLLTGAVMFTAARLATARRGGLAGASQEAFLGFARTVFGSWMYAAFVVAGTRAGDAFSVWVIGDATGGDAANVLANMTSFDTLTEKGLGAGALFVIAILGLLSALLQLVLLVVRQALLIVAAAAVPIAAAAAGTGPGSQAYQRLLGWSLAFVLFKPVGALVYAVAFSAAGTETSDPQQVLLGLILLALVAVVAPALMRMIAPAVATIGGGGGAGGAAVLAGGLALAAHGMNKSGEDSGARKVSEADHPGGSGSPSGSGSGGGGTGGPDGGGTGGGGGSGGRAVGGSGTETSGTGSAAAPSAASSGGSSGGPPGSAGGRDTAVAGAGSAGPAGVGGESGAGAGGTSSAGAASGGSSAGAASGGAAGVAIGAGAHAVAGGAAQVRSAVETDPAAPELGPHEVPR